uniref:Secreted protein n=1 Tax=Oryza sativa subsp. japonica TaxID=39947 RepID=Q655F6_ORYSJ|nr:hypothetical protein [Oryza sativa Japonica Group]
MATIPGLLLICLLMILPVLSTNRSERGGAELVHRSNWVQPLNRAAVDSEAVHGEGGNKVFGKRFARLLPVRPRRLAFLSARVLRAFVDAHNRE